MKGQAEKDHDAQAAERDAVAKQIETLHALFAGLERSKREYPAVASIDWEPLQGGQTLVLRMLYPYEMLRIKLADDQVTELVNRAQGKTAAGVQVATLEQAAAILKGSAGLSSSPAS
jgi:hypothetical protein